MKHRLWRYLLAILLGNIIFFAVERRLPVWAQHEPFTIDWGLAVDFAICVGCYVMIRLVR
jgi:hypothetical protein